MYSYLLDQPWAYAFWLIGYLLAILASSLSLTCLNFSDQINSLSKSCHFHIRDIRRIRHLIFSLFLQPQHLQIHLSPANLTTAIHFTLAYLTSKSQQTSTHSKLIGKRHHNRYFEVFKHFKIMSVMNLLLLVHKLLRSVVCGTGLGNLVWKSRSTGTAVCWRKRSGEPVRRNRSVRLVCKNRSIEELVCWRNRS